MTEEVQMTCPSCGVGYCLPEKFQEARREDHRTWYCPNGHPLHYPRGSSDNERKIEELQRTIRQQQNLLGYRADQIAELQAELRSVPAWRAHPVAAECRVIVLQVELAMCAAGVWVLAVTVLRDAQRARGYRSDAMKLWAGMWARLAGRNAVLARRNHPQARDGEKGVAELSHDLMVKVKPDAGVKA